VGALPPLAEQSRIVTRVEELMRLCDALEAKGQLEATQHAQLVSTLLATLSESETPAQLTDNWHRIATHFDLLLDRPEAVDALEQTILQLAVRGLLVPQDPQDEPASELLKKIRAEKDKLILDGKIKRDKPLPPIAEDEQPFALPRGWEWVPIETLADVGTGTTPSRDNVAFFADGSIPWVTSGETGKPFIAETAQHVTELALSQTSLTVYPVGTLIVAMYGQGKTRGQVSELQIEATTNQACAAIVLVEPSFAHRSFVKLVFEKSYDEIRELSAGGAQPNLNVGKIKATLIPLPPLAEQSRIVTRVAQLRRLCFELRQRLAASQSTQAHLAEALVQQVS
jgi:type I restriction enzyme S subunit